MPIEAIEIQQKIKLILNLQKSSLAHLLREIDLSESDYMQDSIVFSKAQSEDELIYNTLQNHFFNSRLWNFEDKARDPEASEFDIAEVKRAIDKINQLRNDQIEKINFQITKELPEQNPHAPLFSETPGSIFDRLSILNLKVHHMDIQANDFKKGKDHMEKWAFKTKLTKQQIEDLEKSLIFLIEKVSSGEMQFKLYFQNKMYNDPSTNPYFQK